MAGNEINTVLLHARNGEPLAQELLFERYRPYLQLVCRRMTPTDLRPRCDGSDIVQQTCMDALAALTNFRGSSEADFTVWISRLLQSNVKNAYRQHTAGNRDMRREVSLHGPSGSAALRWHSLSLDDSTPSGQVVRGEAALLLAEAIGKLPEKEMIAVTLRYIEGQKLVEVAQDMDTSIGTVAGLVRRGVGRLGKLLNGRLREN